MLSILSEPVDLIADRAEAETELAALAGIFRILFVLLIVAGILALFSGILYSFYRKHLEHKQIMMAIEKGTPLSELRATKPTGPLWAKNLTAGIGFVIAGAGLLCIGTDAFEFWIHEQSWKSYSGYVQIVPFALGVVLFAVGISRLIRGLVQRKAERPRPPAEKRPNWIRDLTVGIALLVPVPAFLLLGRNGFWDWVFVRERSLSSAQKFAVVLFVSGLILPAFGVLYVVRGLLQRKAERRALAMEKGTPVSELERANWITNTAVGAGFIVPSLPVLCLAVISLVRGDEISPGAALITLMFVVIMAVGVALLIRGLLVRKAERRALAIEKAQ